MYYNENRVGKMRLPKDTWKLIKKEYIVGYIEKGLHRFPTLKDLAIKYKLSPSSVTRKSIKDGWEVEKQNYINKSGIKIYEKLNANANKPSAIETQNANDKEFTEMAEAELEKYSSEISDINKKCAFIAEMVINLSEWKLKTEMDKIKETPEIAKEDVISDRKIAEIIHNVNVAQGVFREAMGDIKPLNPQIFKVEFIDNGND